LPTIGTSVSKSRELIEFVATRRAELVRYAGAVSGDAAGADDLVQEAWLRCDRAAAFGAVGEPVHLLWRVLCNLAIDRSRRVAVERRRFGAVDPDRTLTGLADAQPSAEAALIARQEMARIQAVLDRLDPETRAAFEMHRFEGARLREIAARFGISVTTAHDRVARVMVLIRAAVRDDA